MYYRKSRRVLKVLTFLLLLLVCFTSAASTYARDDNPPDPFPNIKRGQAAIDALNGYNMNGRDLNVNEAQDRPRRTGGGGGGGGGFGGGGGGGRRDRW